MSEGPLPSLGSGVRVRFRSRTAFVNTFVCVRLCSFAHTHPAPHPVHELLLFMNVRLRSFAPRDQGCSKTPGGASPTSRASRVTLTTTHIEGLEGRHRGASRGCIKGSIEGCRGPSSVRASRASRGGVEGVSRGGPRRLGPHILLKSTVSSLSGTLPPGSDLESQRRSG